MIGVSWYTGGAATVTISDSNSNTPWTPLTQNGAGGFNSHQFFYCVNPVVGASHTFTSTSASGFQTMKVAAFSGTAASPFDQQNGTTTASAASLSAGALTPSEDNCIVISGVVVDSSTLLLHPSELVEANATQYQAGDHEAGGFGFTIQTTAAAIDPTWNWTGPTAAAMSNAIFKATSAPPPAMGGRFHRIVTRPAAFRPGIAR